MCVCGSVGLISGGANQSQDHQEEVDNVNVEIECGHDVVLGRDRVLVLAAEHELSVKDEIHGEDASSDGAVQDAHDLVSEDDGQEAEREQDQSGDEQEDAHASEVDLGLEGEDGDANDDHARDAGCHENGVGAVRGADGAHEQRLAQREHEEQNDVGGKAARDALAAGQDHHDDEGDGDQDPHHPRVDEEPLRDLFDVDKDGDERDGDEHLKGDDAVDLANEGVADLELAEALASVGHEVVLLGVVAVVEVGRRSLATAAADGTALWVGIGILKVGRHLFKLSLS